MVCNHTLRLQVRQAQAQQGQSPGSNGSNTNTGVLGHKAKLFIAEMMRSAFDGIIQSSFIPQMNSVQAAVVSTSSKSAKMLSGISKFKL